MPLPTQTPITGEEEVRDRTQPVDVLAEFYKAFNGRDTEMLAANWINTQDAVMSNPLGGVKRGWKEVRSVYQKIFGGAATVYVEFYDYTIFQGDGFFQAVGRERGVFTLEGRCIELQIRTSRVFVRHEGRYRQLHHHGSIENPKLLTAYQNAVLHSVVERKNWSG